MTVMSNHIIMGPSDEDDDGPEEENQDRENIPPGPDDDGDDGKLPQR